MNSKIISAGIVRSVIILSIIVALLYGIYQIRTIITYIVVACVVALIGRPMVQFFRRKLRFKNMLAVITTILIILFVLGGVVSSFIPMLVSQAKNLSELDFNTINQNIEQFFITITDSIGIEAPIFEVTDILKIFNFEDISGLVNGIVSFAGNLGIGLFSVIFIAFFFLKDGTKIERMLMNLVNDNYAEQAQESVESIKNLLSRYFIGLLLQITIIFVILTTVLIIFGVKDAVVIAFLCALLNLIPYLGPLIGAVLVCIFTMSSFIGADFWSVILPKTIYVLCGALFAQFIDNFVSQPLIFSNSVKSSPLEIFLVILICGTLFGTIGMVIAIPVYTVIKVILKVFFAENQIIKILTRNM